MSLPDSFTVQSHAQLHAQLDVQLGQRTYPIYIGPGLLNESPKWAHAIAGQHTVVVTNTRVASLCLTRLQQSLSALKKTVTVVVLEDGEAYKTADSLMQILGAMLEAKCDRHTTVIALGGGVIGDMAGLAAGLYMRGVALIQMPTTLLAQVDSSVGGKTAINHPLGKNMIGVFHQPAAVVIDTETLKTLPPRELRCGMAEMIKHGAVLDATYFEWMEAHVDALLQLDAMALIEGILGSCRLKAGVVARDERESGERALLNFGHTFGHAIETGMGYGKWLHGEAVAAGMVMACELSIAQAGCPRAVKDRLVALLARAQLPVEAPHFPFATWHDLMLHDKKNKAGEIRFVLLTQLGQGRTQAVSEADLRALEIW